jgi:hypothetical protein
MSDTTLARPLLCTLLRGRLEVVRVLGSRAVYTRRVLRNPAALAHAPSLRGAYGCGPSLPLAGELDILAARAHKPMIGKAGGELLWLQRPTSGDALDGRWGDVCVGGGRR